MNPRNVSLIALAVGGVAASIGAATSCSSEGGSNDEREETSEARLLRLDARLSGAIFTTVVDGSRVNANVYAAKEDVYLDGGPGPNAPVKAAGLPQGDYFFQVTDPSGKDLLSSDHVSCRKVHVNGAGVIDQTYPGQTYQWKKNAWVGVPCQHGHGIDKDHSAAGAITVQLFPYDDTPNAGGVYKVWLTPVASYASDPTFLPKSRKDAVNGESWAPGNAHGFVPSSSKTDNFKVRKPGKPCDPDELVVRKFHDANGNAQQESNEPDVAGWLVGVTDPLGGTNSVYTTATVLASEGNWVTTENQPGGTRETASFLDGTRLSAYPTASPDVTVVFDAKCAERHEVRYGDLGLGSVTACKAYDRDADGKADSGEPMVEGWGMTLTGTDVTGAAFGPLTQATDANGCTTFGGLMPGAYQIGEQVLATGGWRSTGETSRDVTIESTLTGAVLGGTAFDATFTNLCVGSADFGTKGYWHNKNGLAELTEADIDHANGLAPYSVVSSYFGAGDEPFDGQYEDGKPVAAAQGESGEVLAPAGSARAEVSAFLVDPNAGGDPREQLAQQLLAFVFNVQHRLDSTSATIQLPDGTYVSAASLVEQAITAWTGGTAGERTAMANKLDQLNNSDAVPFVHWTPCAVGAR